MYLKDIDSFLCDNSNYLIDIQSGDLFELDDKDNFLSIYSSGKYYKDSEKEIANFISLNKDRKKNFNTNNEIIDINIIRINVSNACNLACKYCYAHGGNYSNVDSLMSMEVAKDIVKFIKEYMNKADTIFFFGGEPLLNVDVIEYICSEFEDKSFKLITNGTILNDRVIAVLKKYNISIGLSLDGPAEFHDKFRVTKEGKPTFKTILNNIKKLKDNKINILNLQGTYTDFTNKYISKEELINYFNDNFNFKFLTISNDVNSIDNIYDENESYVIDSIKKEKNVLLGLLFNALMNSKAKYNNVDFKCGAGNKSILIYSDGTIYPCQRFISEKMFNLSNIYNFNSNEFLSMRNKFNSEYLKIEKCNNCVAKFICNICLAERKNISEKNCHRIQERANLIYNNLPNYLLDKSLMNHYENILEYIK